MSIPRIFSGPRPDGRRVRHVTEPTRRPNSYPAYRHETSSAASRQWPPICGARSPRRRTGGGADPAAGAALRGARRTDHGSLDPARGELRADRAGRGADRDGARIFPPRSRSGRSSRSAIWSTWRSRVSRAALLARRDRSFYAGGSYFELDRNSPHWSRCNPRRLRDPCLGRIPQLRLELWAIRG